MASTYVIGALVGYGFYSLSQINDAAAKRVGDRSDPAYNANRPARVVPSAYGQSMRKEVELRVSKAKEMMGPDNQIRYFSRHPAAPL